MPNLTQSATDLIDAFNAWALNDLDVTPAAVTHCSRTSLPENPRDAMRLISDVHKSFFDRAAGPNFENLDFTFRARKVTDFDPTNDMYPAASDTRAGAKAQATAKAYFQGRPIEVLHRAAPTPPPLSTSPSKSPSTPKPPSSSASSPPSPTNPARRRLRSATTELYRPRHQAQAPLACRSLSS
ncbi:MAG: hypothetical protein OEQ49_13310 [Myxococcales bacterium]|nr:hypothetical protein [Myxococcales bacterium]